MREVAEAAGVSVATVSRVINRSRTVNAEAERAVEQAVEELGYRPNHLASALRRQRTRSVAMVVPHIANPYFPRVVQAVERALAADDHQLLLADSHDDPRVERERVHALLDRRVDGLVLVPSHEHDSRDLLAEIDVPYVLLDRMVSDVVCDCVVSDDEGGIRAAVQHVRARGRTRLAYVGATPDTSTARTRLETFRREAGGDAPALLGDFTLDWGREAARRLLATGLPDAVVASNDLAAIGVALELRAAGVALPGQVAITGYDDIGFAEVSYPALTTIRQPADELGEAAVALLLERIRGHDGPARTVRLSPQLVVRDSTGGPA